MIFHITFCITFCMFQCTQAQGAVRTCSTKDSHWINEVEVNVTKTNFQLRNIDMDDPDNPSADLYLTVEWNILSDEEVDGFVVSLIKQSNGFLKQTLYPELQNTTCSFSNSHIYLSSINESDCSPNYSFCSSSCLCDRNNCSIVNETDCTGTKSYMARFSGGKPFTVPSSTTSLEFKVKMSSSYDLTITPYYRQYYASQNNALTIHPQYCPEAFQKEDGYSLDDGAEICCRMGNKDTKIRRIEFGEAIPDFNEGTFNLSVTFQNLFYNNTDISISVPRHTSQADALGADLWSITELEPPQLDFSTNLTVKCLTSRSLYSVDIYSLNNTFKYGILFTLSPACNPCHAYETFSVGAMLPHTTKSPRTEITSSKSTNKGTTSSALAVPSINNFLLFLLLLL